MHPVTDDESSESFESADEEFDEDELIQDHKLINKIETPVVSKVDAVDKLIIKTDEPIVDSPIVNMGKPMKEKSMVENDTNTSNKDARICKTDKIEETDKSIGSTPIVKTDSVKDKSVIGQRKRLDETQKPVETDRKVVDPQPISANVSVGTNAHGPASESHRQAVETHEKKAHFPQMLKNPFDASGSNPWFNSFLKSASDTMMNLKTSVTESARLVIESVDTTLGAPDPKELALKIKQLKLNEEDDNEKECEQDAITSNRMQLESNEQAHGDTHYVNKLASLWKSPDLSTVISSGLDALENVGRKTIDVLRAERLEGVASKLTGLDGNEQSTGKTLSNLVSRGRQADLKREGEESNNPDMELLKKSAMRAEETIQTTCVRDSSVERVVKRMRRELEIEEDEKEGHCVDFNEAINNFEQAMQSGPWSLTLDWTFFSSVLEEVEGELNSLAYGGHSEISDVADKCTELLNRIHDASIKLFVLLLKDCGSTDAVKCVALSLLQCSTTCVQQFARMIKRQCITNDREHLSDILSKIFFKESDLSADVEDAYKYLQRCVIAEAIRQTKKEE